MLRILHDTNYDFIRWWKVMAGITLAFILLGLGSLAVKAPNYSIEFTGGTLMQLEFVKPPDVAEVRAALDQAGIHGAEIQQFGTNREFTVRAQNAGDVAAQANGAESIAVRIEQVLKQKFGENALKVVRTEAVGPRVG
ncbi:MAG: preprotein translocase subunit SecF, partial [Gemmatimonadaceae bacterium]|nr:preprotein translocase subunit SecF [Gemmatimonadaceae bacterium]